MERIQTLPEPARQLWEVVAGLYDILPAFEQDQYAMLGGGTLLAARWRDAGPPRQSEDLDLKIRAPAKGPAAQRERKERIEAAMLYLEHAGAIRASDLDPLEDAGTWTQTWVFPERAGRKLDLVELHTTIPWQPELGSVEGIEVPLEPTGSILCGKLWRTSLGLARDGFDLAVAGNLSPTALEDALSTIGEERTQWAMQYLAQHSARMEIEGETELQGVKQLWEDYARDPGNYARRAIGTGWERVAARMNHEILNEENAIAKHVRLLQKAKGRGKLDVQIGRRGVTMTWWQPGEEIRVVVGKNVSDRECASAVIALENEAKAKKDIPILERTLENEIAQKRAISLQRGRSR